MAQNDRTAGSNQIADVGAVRDLDDLDRRAETGDVDPADIRALTAGYRRLAVALADAESDRDRARELIAAARERMRGDRRARGVPEQPALGLLFGVEELIEARQRQHSYDHEEVPSDGPTS